MVEEDNALIDFYRYGDNYAIPWPYDEDMEAVMQTIEKIVKDNKSSCSFQAASYGAFSTADGWVFNMLEDQVNAVSGTGNNMLIAAYNALLKFIKNENRKEEDKEAAV